MRKKFSQFYLYVILMIFFSSTLNLIFNSLANPPSFKNTDSLALVEKNTQNIKETKELEKQSESLEKTTTTNTLKESQNKQSKELLFSSNQFLKPLTSYQKESKNPEKKEKIKSPQKELSLSSTMPNISLNEQTNDKITFKKLRPSDKCADIPFAYSNNICPKIVSFDLEYLLMNFFEDGLTYISIVNNESIKAKNKQKYKSGVRLLSEFKVYKDVYLDLAWTYINMRRTSSITAESDTLLASFYPPNVGSISDARAKITGDFNAWDLFLVKPYYVSACFISKLLLGIKGALIDQDLKINYDIVSTTNLVKAKNDYWGVGLSAGYKSKFLITKNWLIDTKTFLSILYGRNKISQNSSAFLIPEATYNVKEKTYKVLPNIEMGIGVSYDRYFTKNIDKLSFRVAYEFQYWWNQNNLKRFFSTDPVAIKTVSRRNLKFNGFSFGINIDI